MKPSRLEMELKLDPFEKTNLIMVFKLFLELGLVLVPISIFLNHRTNGVIPT
jgi:hypothetical protein